MPNPKRKIAQRGAVAVASTALVFGGSVLAYPAFATEASDAQIDAATPAPAQDEAVDTTGLAEAIERDLGKSPEQYLKDSELNVTATELKKQLEEADIDHNVVIEDGVVVVQVGEADLEKVEKIVAAVNGEAEEAPASAEATDASEESEKAEEASAEATEEASAEATEETSAEATEEASAEATEEATAEATEEAEEEVEADVKVETAEVSSVREVVKELEKKLAPSEVKRLTSITKNIKGDIVITAGGPESVTEKVSRSASKSAEEGLTLEEFNEVVDGVELVAEGKGGPEKPAAVEDIFGGIGYAIDATGEFTGQVGLCSIGFNAWDPSGNDAIITAGHCSHDGTTTKTAVLEHTAPDEIAGISNLLGTFGFNQFGMPGNEGFSATDPDFQNWPEGTDIAVIEDINPELNLHAGVTQWPAGEDVRDQTLAITNAGAAAVGAEACNSGRTTGWRCAPITGEGVFYVIGFGADGQPDENNIRTVWGYTSEVDSGEPNLLPGDSGGAVVVGSRAVGINSAYGNGGLRAQYAGLADAMNKTAVGDYEVKFFVNAPVITAPANGSEIEAGSAITGSVEDAATGARVEVIVDGEVIDTVNVDADGNFTFNAPETEGAFSFQLKARSGDFNESELTSGNYTVVAPAPTQEPTEEPTQEPTQEPTEEPTQEPTEEPTQEPTEEPTQEPTEEPTQEPTEEPTQEPTEEPTQEPTEEPTEEPTATATAEPSESPTATATATAEPTEAPEESESPEATTSPKQNDDDNDGPLANTGSSAVPALAVAGALGLGGALLLMLRRTNRRHG